MKNNLLIALFFLSVYNIMAQKGSITGKVTTAEGTALAYANITLNKTTLGTETSSEGTFILSDIPAGRYILSVSEIGYKKRNTPVVVKPNETLQLPVIILNEAVEA